jgi:hypothetical protein
MKAPPSRTDNVLRGQLQEPNQNETPSKKRKDGRFENLVARCYQPFHKTTLVIVAAVVIYKPLLAGLM